MDRTLKERIIGAIVLVVFVVLVVPVFLDGPPGNSEIVSETVTLPGQAEQKMQTRVLERDRSKPVGAPLEPRPEPDVTEPDATPAIAAPEEARIEPDDRPEEPAPVARSEPEAATRQEPVAAEPVTRDEPQVDEAVATESATGMWAVQLGSFSNEANAKTLAADLRNQGFAAFLAKVSTDKGQLHRVRIGPLADRGAAEAEARKLSAAGHKGQVVPHP